MNQPPFLPVNRPESDNVTFISANGMVWGLFVGNSMGVDMEKAHEDVHEFVNWQIGFFVQYINECTKEMNAEELLEHLEGCYGFPVGKMDGVIDLKTGVYTYEGDPDLYPIAQVNTAEATLLLYAYGIVGIVNKVISEEKTIRDILTGKDIGAEVTVFRMD
ncbi:hypothetical protein OTK49_20740 [Vibrio coralliirubri]|uniref:hypothetical protein n=1 Tax=Vibrio coralliirubri TaxID=1516159 RepID=UPI00228409EF|nr:hypothetical protein [Vibrio coralliirubri]MCY9864946.1 hypothetical protein [Vibrio coralliirubri]